MQVFLQEVLQDFHDQTANLLLARDRNHHPEVVERRRLDSLLNPNENVLRRLPPHPSRGGSQGYDVAFHVDSISRRLEGFQVRPSNKLIRRWIQNGVIPKMKRGGRKRVLKAQHLLMLTTFLLAHPDATLYECKAFIYCNTSNNLCVGEMTIRCALSSIGFSRKKMSHVATQAFAPINIQRRNNFWTMPYPYGIVDCPRCRIIDSDECGFQVTDCNRTHGYSVAGVRVIKKGNYSKSTKITLIASIEAGNPNLPPNVSGSRQKP